MSDIQKRIIVAGINIKLARGENLDEVLTSYVNLTEEEKQEIRDVIVPKGIVGKGMS